MQVNPLRKLFCLSLMLFFSAAATQVAANKLPQGVIPAPRTIEYPWMSVATWNQMHAEDIVVANQGGVDLLFVGDSITAGWDSEIWKKNFAPYNAANFGIGGDHTANVLWRLQHGTIGKLQPKAIVLLIGVNNFGHLNETPDEVFQGVKAVVNQLQLAFPKAKILLNAVFPYEQAAASPARSRVKTLNQKIMSLGNDGRIFYKDYGPLFLQKDGSISKAIFGDFLHPTAKGYQIWADAMLPTLHEWLD